MAQQGHFATMGEMHCRSRKANFTIYPTDTPAIYPYALNTSSSTQYYVTLNDTTKVQSWRIYTSTDSSNSNPKFKKLTTVPKEGFETMYTAGYHQWSIVKALDVHGKGIRSSSRVVETFVPSEKLAAMCEEGGCPDAKGYDFGNSGGYLASEAQSGA